MRWSAFGASEQHCIASTAATQAPEMDPAFAGSIIGSGWVINRIKVIENGNDVLGIAEIKSAVLEDRRASVGFLRFVDLRASVLHRTR
jgi:hypothetical protein